MASFVLVHGAWHGAWCWQRVLPALVRAGHRAHAVTLTGLGERAHLLNPAIDLETHIRDVQMLIETEELQDLMLVVHSYAGMIGTAVADRDTGRLRQLVYLDAVLPLPGESWSSTHAPQTREARIASAEADPLYSFVPPDPALFGLQGEDAAWVARRQTRQPGRPYTQPLQFDPQRVARVPLTYIACTQPPLATMQVSQQRLLDPQFWGGAWQRNATVHKMATGHDPMVSNPEGLVGLLLELARTSPTC